MIAEVDWLNTPEIFISQYKLSMDPYSDDAITSVQVENVIFVNSKLQTTLQSQQCINLNN